MKKLFFALLLFVSCGKEYSYKYVYKVSFTSPRVNTIVTSYYTFDKQEKHFTTEWVKTDFISHNIEYLADWRIDTLWVDSLGLTDWD